MAVVSWVGPEVWSDGANGMLIYLSWVLHAASAGNWFKKLLRVEAQRARGHLGKGHNWWFLPCLISESVLTPPTALCTPLYFFLYVASPIVNTLCDLLECKLMAAGISVPLCHRRLSIKICQMKEQMVASSRSPWDLEGETDSRLFPLLELWKELQAFLGQEEWRAMG